MEKKYVVKLSDADRAYLQEFISKGERKAYQIKRANILLKADIDGAGWTDVQIAEVFSCHPQTVRNLRKRFCEVGVTLALGHIQPSHPPREQKLDGGGEARLIALGCSEPPEGFGRWSLRMLADKLVALKVVESISPETVRQTLKKTR